MLDISTEVRKAEKEMGATEKKKQSLKQYVLEKLRTWINGLLEAERDEFLQRGRHRPVDEDHANYRNGYRPRQINFFGHPRDVRIRLHAQHRGTLRVDRVNDPLETAATEILKDRAPDAARRLRRANDGDHRNESLRRIPDQ